MKVFSSLLNVMFTNTAIMSTPTCVSDAAEWLQDEMMWKFLCASSSRKTANDVFEKVLKTIVFVCDIDRYV